MTCGARHPSCPANVLTCTRVAQVPTPHGADAAQRAADRIGIN